MGFSHHAWWLFAGFWDPTTCIEKNVKKGHESSDWSVFFATRKGGSGCSSLNFSSPKGPQVSDHWRFLAAKKKKRWRLKGYLDGGPRVCLGWGERCKENVLSNIFRVQFFGVFAVTHVLQMESWTSSTSQASFMTVDHLGGASPPPNNSGSRWWNGDASFGGYVLTDWDVLMIVGFSRP